MNLALLCDGINRSKWLANGSLGKIPAEMGDRQSLPIRVNFSELKRRVCRLLPPLPKASDGRERGMPIDRPIDVRRSH
jgi:hypothetical protein